ncbi:DNA-directed RNA polymerase III subunit RPC4-like isoform X2 [Homarus americanus]|uniref:DNA-directed RNA polymerase III subunit RPC4-like isoform X2 n=1 Tax=Homarus americanus TaxID=6706 RepID=UPI001C457C98|nr:DNA-directed RNA polymerase III subunit RPC4-like isoform X2 [Homarus americanus]
MAEQNGEVKNPFAKRPGIGRASELNLIGSSTTPGSSSSMSARLPSFRGPRDLTLSASSSATPVKPSLMTRTRKTFSPNIPVRRGKNEKVLDSRSDKGPKRNRERDKKEGGRGRGRGREYVQTTGSLFGEGIAAAPQRRGMMGGYGVGGGGSGAGKSGEPGFIHKPVLNLDTVNNIDKEHEDQKLKEILRDDFIDDLEDVIGRDNDGDLFPVQLPMVDTGLVFKEEDGKDTTEVKPKMSPNLSEGIEVKCEPAESTEDMTAVDNAIKDITLETKNLAVRKVTVKGGLPAKEKAPELSVAQLLAGKHEDFMFFQLPNSLPSHPPEIKQESSGTRSQNTAQQQSQTAPNNLELDEDEEKRSSRQYCTLNTLPEGQIGTLKIYKSGRTELWLGDHKLTVNKGTQVGFLQVFSTTVSRLQNHSQTQLFYLLQQKALTKCNTILNNLTRCPHLRYYSPWRNGRPLHLARLRCGHHIFQNKGPLNSSLSTLMCCHAAYISIILHAKHSPTK